MNLFKKTPVPRSAIKDIEKTKSIKTREEEQLNSPEEDETVKPEFQEILERVKQQVPHMEDSGELHYNCDNRDNGSLTDHAQAAITSISDGVRPIIQHIPYNASAALTPDNISKDQMENKTTRDIISRLRTDKIKSKKLRRFTLINGYLLGKKAKGSNELKIMLPLYSGLIMMCIAHLQCHSGLKGTLSIFNRFYDMENTRSRISDINLSGMHPNKNTQRPKKRVPGWQIKARNLPQGNHSGGLFQDQSRDHIV